MPPITGIWENHRLKSAGWDGEMCIDLVVLLFSYWFDWFLWSVADEKGNAVRAGHF